MQQALRLGTKDASLLYHAGMIAHGLGDIERAQQYLRQALETNPYFSLLQAEKARQTLTEMQRTAQSSTPTLAICHSAAGVPETCG